MFFRICYGLISRMTLSRYRFSRTLKPISGWGVVRSLLIAFKGSHSMQHGIYKKNNEEFFLWFRTMEGAAVLVKNKKRIEQTDGCRLQRFFFSFVFPSISWQGYMASRKTFKMVPLANSSGGISGQLTVTETSISAPSSSAEKKRGEKSLSISFFLSSSRISSKAL